jgi:hypothetical protein
VDIGANLSAEGGDDHVVKVVDIVDTFHLQVAPSLLVSAYSLSSWFYSVISIVVTCRSNLLFTRSNFQFVMKRYIENLITKLDAE